MRSGRPDNSDPISRTPGVLFERSLKTRASYRTIGRSPRLQRILEEHLAEFGIGPNGLILTNRYGQPLRYSVAAGMFREHARPLGIPRGTGLHVLRHTCVSNLIREGVTPKEIQVHVGHESIAETMDTYGHLFESEASGILAKLDRAADRHESAITGAGVSITG